MPGPMRHGSMTLFAALNPQRVGAARADAPSIPSRATSTSRRAAAARACGAAAAVSAAAAGIRITFAAGWRHSVGSPVQPVRRPRLVIVRPACHGAVVAAVPGVLVADPLIAVGRCIGRWGRRCRIVGDRTGRDGAETQSEYGRESEFALHVQFSLGKRATGPGLVAYRVPVRGRRRGQRRPGGCWRHGLGDERALCSPRKIYLRWLVKISRCGRECCPGDPAMASRWVIAPRCRASRQIGGSCLASPARRRAWAPQPDAAMAHQPDCGRIEASQRSVQLARISYTLAVWLWTRTLSRLAAGGPLVLAPSLPHGREGFGHTIPSSLTRPGQ